MCFRSPHWPHPPCPPRTPPGSVFPAWSGTFVTVLSLFTLLSLMNAVLLGAPRIIFGIGRDGLFSRRATEVGAGGTPRVALLFTAVGVAAFITSGKFEEIIAVTSILLAVLYFVNYLALIVLRVREPDLPRPFRAWGYPVTTGLVLVGSLLFLIAAVHDDHATAMRAAVFLFAALAGLPMDAMEAAESAQFLNHVRIEIRADCVTIFEEESLIVQARYCSSAWKQLR